MVRMSRAPQMLKECRVVRGSIERCVAGGQKDRGRIDVYGASETFVCVTPPISFGIIISMVVYSTLLHSSTCS